MKFLKGGVKQRLYFDFDLLGEGLKWILLVFFTFFVNVTKKL